MDGESPESFEKYIRNELNSRVKFAERVYTLPDRNENGSIVNGTGDRSDVLFYIHDEDISKFAVPRLAYGIRWWEDVFYNEGQGIYRRETLNKYPKKW